MRTEIGMGRGVITCRTNLHQKQRHNSPYQPLQCFNNTATQSVHMTVSDAHSTSIARSVSWDVQAIRARLSGSYRAMNKIRESGLPALLFVSAFFNSKCVYRSIFQVCWTGSWKIRHNRTHCKSCNG